MLPDRLPWFIAGPVVGLLIVGLFAIANRPLGVSGSYVQVASFLRRRPGTEVWRVWYFVGLAAGALLVAVLRGGPSFSLEYGALGRLLPLPVLVPVLVAAGALMGYGARWAGGCTSGHGMCGTALLDRGSIVATATFMATAIALSFGLRALTGGAL